MPLWLLECLLQNKTPSVPLTKVSFVLLPFKEPGVEPLPELLPEDPWEAEREAEEPVAVRVVCEFDGVDSEAVDLGGMVG